MKPEFYLKNETDYFGKNLFQMQIEVFSCDKIIELGTKRLLFPKAVVEKTISDQNLPLPLELPDADDFFNYCPFERKKKGSIPLVQGTIFSIKIDVNSNVIIKGNLWLELTLEQQQWIIKHNEYFSLQSEFFSNKFIQKSNHVIQLSSFRFVSFELMFDPIYSQDNNFKIPAFY